MASKGRPNIEQLTGQGQALATIRDFEPDKTARTHQNMLYQAMGDKFVTDHADEIPGAERLRKGRGCLEQLGRMIIQYGDASIVEGAKIAADALNSGITVKQTESFLRHARTTGKFDESLLIPPSKLEAATSKKDTAACDDCFVNRYIKKVPHDALTRLEVIMLIDILNNVDNALHRRKLDLLEGETKADIIQNAKALREKLAHIYIDTE